MKIIKITKSLNVQYRSQLLTIILFTGVICGAMFQHYIFCLYCRAFNTVQQVRVRVVGMFSKSFKYFMVLVMHLALQTSKSRNFPILFKQMSNNVQQVRVEFVGMFTKSFKYFVVPTSRT